MIASNCAFADLSGSYYIDTNQPQSATELQKSPKKATGSSIGILYLVAFGDASIEKIAKDAGIKKIRYIDKKTFSILGLFVQDTYTVAGE